MPPPPASSPLPIPLETDIPFIPKGPGAEVSLSLEDADLDELVRTMSQLSGKRFVVATSRAKGFKATGLFAAKKISVAEAYRTFLAILQANGLTVLPDEQALLKIVDATQDVTRQPTPVSHLTASR